MRPSTRKRWQRLARLQGLIDEAPARTLCDLAAEVPADLAIVEIGSYRGKSTSYLAEGARLGNGARVFAVDPWDLASEPGKYGYNDPAVRKSFDAQLRSLDLRGVVTAEKGFSVDVAAKWRKPGIGLLFIDGDHTYEGVIDDFRAWAPHLATGAVVVFDDYDTPRNPGVKEACDELKESGELVDWSYEPHPLAIARKPSSPEEPTE